MMVELERTRGARRMVMLILSTDYDDACDDDDDDDDNDDNVRPDLRRNGGFC
ncbi:hypothetical protein BO82DRAFT_20542 [Aspergillus uvarum CBS 121591]|uniref:Uncharacterized protein n=1 Tax=Aspergillus uvarum CBS 121591 TaxID=1448315 RepID=A0A319BSC3_9EURO|nr:hypothetical protein BO82DRAFT_20542 [Aspergillus uvarum CBS 121591]PYH75575.1 hypothetical protein BO82DRAFT_20542 [Aspergillus uvarum CBS 121591]